MAIAGGFRRYLAGRYMRFGIFCVTLYIPVNFKMMKRIVVLYVILALAVSCGGRGTAKRAAAAPAAPQAPVAFREPAEYTYRVKAVYPHDTGAYTQGLFWLDGYLYEGTGQNGRSGFGGWNRRPGACCSAWDWRESISARVSHTSAARYTS